MLPELSNAEIARYGRQLVLEPPLGGLDVQRRLKAARVVVVGAGGLGSSCLSYLCAAGVGTLGVVDHDAVDVSNLQRQTIHSELTLGQPKTASAAAHLRALNSTVCVVEHHALLGTDNALALLRDYHIVVDATDNVPSRYLLNDCCVVLGIPLVSGSALGFQGQLTVYNLEAITPCYRCLFPAPPPPESVTSCADGGVLGPVTGVIGSMMALETLKVIARVDPAAHVLAGRLLTFDGLRGVTRTARLRQRVSDCFCGSRPTALPVATYEAFCGGAPFDDHAPVDVDTQRAATIDVEELKQLIDSGAAITLVDVRTPVQFSICRLPQSLNVPLRDLTADALSAVGQPLRQFVFICRRGVDSRVAVMRALQWGHSGAVHVRGGLQMWSRDVDSDFPVY